MIIIINSIYDNTRLATSKHVEENEHDFLCSICCSAIGQLVFQMSRVTPGVEFSNALSRFKKRKKNSSSKHLVRRFHVVEVQSTSKKCTKKRDARAKLLFGSQNHLFFDVVVVIVAA